MQPENQELVKERLGIRLIAAVEKIGLKSLSTGNFIWFVALIICALGLWRLDSKDLKEVLLKVLVTYGWTGYVVAGGTIFVSVRIMNWRERFYQQEIARISNARNVAIQQRLDLPLQSSQQGESQR
jgi:hypothetical protein